MADITLTGGSPTIIFDDTDDSTTLSINTAGYGVMFLYGSSSVECGRVVLDASMQFQTPLIVEAVAANESAFTLASPVEDDTRIRSTNSSQLQIASFSAGWNDMLTVTGGANPMLEVTGSISNQSGGGKVIVFANDVNSGDIARFYSGANLRASILNDGLVDLSTGGLCLVDCGAFPTAVGTLLRNIYFEDNASTPKIGVVTTSASGSGFCIKTATLT